jgi:hypothetical protein
MSPAILLALALPCAAMTDNITNGAHNLILTHAKGQTSFDCGRTPETNLVCAQPMWNATGEAEVVVRALAACGVGLIGGEPSEWMYTKTSNIGASSELITIYRTGP